MNSPAVLIIDDEKDLCFLLGNLLRERNYAVTITNNLRDGIEKLKEVNPSILFLDIRLPDGSGLDVIRDIKKQNPRIKIILMSAYDGVNERKQAIESGADLFIAKPLNSDLISRTLQNIQSKPAKY